MEYRREYELKPEQVNALVRECVERRTIVNENGELSGFLKNGGKLLIERLWIKEYIRNISKSIASHDINDIDLISVLYVLDQDVFLEGWDGIDEKFSKMCARLVDNYKSTLAQHSRNKPEDVIEMVQNAMKYDDRKESIDDYVLQLLEENAITEQILDDAGFFKSMFRDELVRLCIDNKVSVNTLANMNSLSAITETQIRQLSKAGFFYMLTPGELESLHKNGFLSSKGIIEMEKIGAIKREQAIEALGGIEKIAQTYRRLAAKKNKRSAALYFDMIEPKEVLTLYLNGKLVRTDLEKVKLDKNALNELSAEDFLKIAKLGFPNGIEFTNDELLENYISKYSDKNTIELTGILSLYTPKMISNLLKEDKIDVNFVNKLDTKILDLLQEKEREEYVERLIKSCKKEMDDSKYAKLMLELIEKSQLPREKFRELNISQNALMDMYLDGNISEETAIQYFNEGIFGMKELWTIYGENYSTIIKLVKDRMLDERALAIFPKDVIEESLILEEITEEDVFKIYSKYEGIDAQDLRDIFDQYEEVIDKRVNVVDMIDENFDTSRIRELFINNILTHSDVLELKERGRITDKQSEEIAQINRERLYNEIFGKGITNETDDFEADGDLRDYYGRTLAPVSKKIPMMSAKKRAEFFKKVGKCDFRDVEARDTQGRAAPFEGYKIIGFPEYGIVVFENFDKANNATYIMTLQELKSYVIKDEHESIVFRKSKKALREDITNGRAVSLCNHTPNWGNNVVGAIKELSKDAKESISHQKQTSLADMMRQEFIKSRIEQIGGKDNSLVEMLVETRARVAKKQVDQANVRTLEQEVEAALGDKMQTQTKGEEYGEQ